MSKLNKSNHSTGIAADSGLRSIGLAWIRSAWIGSDRIGSKGSRDELEPSNWIALASLEAHKLRLSIEGSDTESERVSIAILIPIAIDPVRMHISMDRFVVGESFLLAVSVCCLESAHVTAEVDSSRAKQSLWAQKKQPHSTTTMSTCWRRLANRQLELRRHSDSGSGSLRPRGRDLLAGHWSQKRACNLEPTISDGQRHLGR